MRRLVTILMMLCILYVPRLSVADDASSQLLEHEGSVGFWFPEVKATKMLGELREIPLLRQKITLLDEKLKLKDSTIALLREDVKITEQIAGKWESAFKSALGATSACEEKLERKDSWFKSPALWFGVGFVVAALGAVGLNYGLASTR